MEPLAAPLPLGVATGGLFFPLCTVLLSIEDNPRSNCTLGDVALHPRRQ